MQTYKHSKIDPGWRRCHGLPTKRHTVLGWRARDRRRDAAAGAALMMLAVAVAAAATLSTMLSAM